MPDLVKGNIGTVGSYDVAFVNGNLQITLTVPVVADLDAVLQKATNPTEKALLGVLEAVLKGVG